MVIYIDVLFFSNMLINSIIIFCSGLVMRERVRPFKIAVGGAVAALYSVIMFFPRTYLLFTLAGKVLFTVLFVMIYFRCGSIRELIKALAVFFGVSLIFSGFAYLSAYRMNGAVSNGVPYFNISLKRLFISIAIAFIIIKIFISVCIRQHEVDIQEAKIKINDKIINAKILSDTGCELKEPISGKPVILVSGKLRLSGGRLVYMKTVTDSGFIYVHKADEITCACGKYGIDKNSCYIGFVDVKFSSDNLYNAVAPPEVFFKKNKNFKYRGIFNVYGTKEFAERLIPTIGKIKKRQCVLHRRERNTSSASEQGRGTAMDGETFGG